MIRAQISKETFTAKLHSPSLSEILINCYTYNWGNLYSYINAKNITQSLVDKKIKHI